VDIDEHERCGCGEVKRSREYEGGHPMRALVGWVGLGWVYGVPYGVQPFTAHSFHSFLYKWPFVSGLH
jgi:hypothetical protein